MPFSRDGRGRSEVLQLEGSSDLFLEAFEDAAAGRPLVDRAKGVEVPVVVRLRRISRSSVPCRWAGCVRSARFRIDILPK